MKQGTAGPALGKFNFTTGKTHRLRLINPSSSGSPILFSIDNHTMTVIANDFVPLVGESHLMASRPLERLALFLMSNC